MGNCLQKKPQVINEVWEAREPAEEYKEQEPEVQEEPPFIVASSNFRNIIITIVSIMGIVASNFEVSILNTILGTIMILDFYFANRHLV